jgi:transcriptional regulator with PAS, ATPase and Fis domain
MPLGGEASKKVDVRIIAATNRELLKEIEKGRFRNDLYYRLYVYPITIPPLRNRKEDIPELIEIFVKHYTKKHLKSISKVSKLVVNELTNYPWPGNIRELENVLERAVIVCNADTIKIKDIGPVISEPNQSKRINKLDILPLEELEREHILRALNHTNWKIHGASGTAELLGINPSTLRSRIKKLSITKS